MNDIDVNALTSFYSLAMGDVMQPIDHSGDAKMLIDFYSGGKDTHGRTLEFILSQNNEWWETTHNFIQFLFPLPEASFAVPNSPIADASVYEFLANGAAVKATGAIDNVFDRLISFLGLKPFIEFHNEGWKSDIAPSWWKQDNHNHLRVARALRCLDLIHSTKTAYLACVLRLALKSLAIKFPDGCSNRNLQFWRVLILGREDVMNKSRSVNK